jgi:transposase
MVVKSMRLDLDNLPSDTALLHQLVRDMAGVVSSRNDEIERLQAIIKKLQRMQFGRRSERLDPDQFALGLEDVDTDIGTAQEKIAQTDPVRSLRPHRTSLPDHLPREEVLLDIDDSGCAGCGGVVHKIGESQSEMLDWVPATLKVIRITRPKYACRTCGTVTQVAAPERVIAGGLATPALLAQVLVAKYCDHLPLYRQSQMFARHGVDLARSTLAGWVGGRAGGSKRCTSACARSCLQAAICSPTTRRFPCLIRGAARQRPDGCGFMLVTNDRGAVLHHLWRCLCSSPTEGPNVHSRILRTSKAWCMSMAMPGSSG